MMRSLEPRWIDAATRAYSVCLRLYPKAIRQAHGGEMQQAFQARCREVAQGKLSAWRLFGRELAPDLVASAVRAHLEASGAAADSRVLPLLVLLVCMAFALATQDAWSGPVQAAYRFAKGTAGTARTVHYRREREEAVRGLAGSLVAQGDAESRAVAGLLLGSLYRDWTAEFSWTRKQWVMARSPGDGARATELAAGVVVGGGSLAALSLATQACSIEAGCNEDLALRTLLARDPENAFNWMLEFGRAARRKDAARTHAAMAGLLRTTYFEAHTASLQRRLFSSALARKESDEQMAMIGSQLGRMRWMWAGDYRDDAWPRLDAACSFYKPPPWQALTWLQTHPEDRDACLHLARMLVTSSDAEFAVRGWRLLHEAGVAMSPGDLGTMREADWLSSKSRRDFARHYHGRGDFTPWTRDEWLAWTAAWAPGDGEIPALRRWLPTKGVPAQPPPDYRASAER